MSRYDYILKGFCRDADPFEHENVFKFVIQLEQQKKRVNKLLGRTIIR